MNKYFKKSVAVLLSFFLICNVSFFSGCVLPMQNIKSTDINETFEEDYPLMQQVTDYMLSLINEQDLHMITIRNSRDPMTIDYGEKMDIEDDEIKQTLSKLFECGYIRISFYKNERQDETVICFERWKKSGEPAFRSGFAYSLDNVGELNIQYIISQEELSIPGWYYYEEDYNEWRLNQN